MQTTDFNLTKWVKRVVALSVFVMALWFLLFPSRPMATMEAKSHTPMASLSSGTTAVDNLVATDSQPTQRENECATCHDKIAQGFVKTVHGKATKHASLLSNHADANSPAVSCQTCHGDGAEHIANGGDVTKIKNPTKMKPFEASQTCLQCHSQMKAHANWRGSKHEASGLSCLSCHSAHHSPIAQFSENKIFATTEAETKLLKAKSEADTCYQCHTDVRKAQFQRSTHLFRNESREHQITCSACHEPHGSIGEKMMRTGSINETCYQCHTEKRGPFLFEHSPVRENCDTCHKPHGSNNVALLAAKSPMLCQQCHIQGRHQTVPGVPNSAFTLNRGCVNCHSQIHGSNHPSGINLQR